MFLMVNYMKKAIFLDRDGVINKEVNYLIRKKDIKIINGVPEALKELKDRGFMLIVISNQPSVARGWVTKEGIEEINNEINRRIKEKSDIEIDKFYFCPHHPNATLKKFRKICKCRKPCPGMILQATKEFDINLEESWVIGDRISDIATGKEVGCKTILIEKEYSYNKIEGKDFNINIKPDFKAKDLFAAIKKI